MLPAGKYKKQHSQANSFIQAVMFVKEKMHIFLACYFLQGQAKYFSNGNSTFIFLSDTSAPLLSLIFPLKMNNGLPAKHCGRWLWSVLGFVTLKSNLLHYKITTIKKLSN